MTPTFIGIGAQKCASTWLYDILSDHPDVVLSEEKEIDFFSYHFDHGFQWYERHFQSRVGAQVVGEISPSYFHEPAVPSRLKMRYPNIKILLSLRDPVARAISNHKHEVRVGHLQGQDLSFENGLNNNPMYVEQGKYATFLSRWLEHFSKDQLLVVLFDDVVAEPDAVAMRVYKFLEIAEHHQPLALNKRSNVSHFNRYPKLEKLRKAMRSLLKKIGLDVLWRVGQSMGLKKMYTSFNRISSDGVIPNISQKTISNLKVLFASEINELEKLIGRSLTNWR